MENLRIIPAEAELTLGACLNRGIARAEGSTIAKMDDDDYYAPEYLGDMSDLPLAYSRADVVRKRAHYMYLEDRSTLIVRLPDQDHRYVDFVIGPTIVAAKSLLTEIPFEDRTRGEDFVADAQRDCCGRPDLRDGSIQLLPVPRSARPHLERSSRGPARDVDRGRLR